MTVDSLFHVVDSFVTLVISMENLLQNADDIFTCIDGIVYTNDFAQSSYVDDNFELGHKWLFHVNYQIVLNIITIVKGFCIPSKQSSKIFWWRLCIYGKQLHSTYRVLSWTWLSSLIQNDEFFPCKFMWSYDVESFGNASSNFYYTRMIPMDLCYIYSVYHKSKAFVTRLK